MTIDPDYTAPLHGLPRPALTQFDTRAIGGNKLATPSDSGSISFPSQHLALFQSRILAHLLL